MADTITAKKVRLLAPGGAVLNFAGVTGNTHKAYALPITMIKKALDRGILVYEELAEAAEDGSTEVKLTLENYTTDVGGATVEGDVVTDIEEEVIETHAAEAAAWIEAVGETIKAKQEAIVAAQAEETVSGSGDDTVVSGTGTDTVVAGTGSDTVVSGTGTDTVVAGTGSDTVVSGSGSDSIVGSGQDPVEPPGEGPAIP